MGLKFGLVANKCYLNHSKNKKKKKKHTNTKHFVSWFGFSVVEFSLCVKGFLFFYVCVYVCVFCVRRRAGFRVRKAN